MIGDDLKKYWYWLASIEDMWFDKIRKAIEYYDNPKDIFTAGEKSLMNSGVFCFDDIVKIKESKAKFDLDGEIAHISMSIGIALFPRDGLTISEIIKNADIAMYSAKNAGKNSFKFFNSYMEDDFNRRNDLADTFICYHIG